MANRRRVSVYDYPEHLNPFSDRYVSPFAPRFYKNKTWSSKLSKKLNRSVSWIDKTWFSADGSNERNYHNNDVNFDKEAVISNETKYISGGVSENNSRRNKHPPAVLRRRKRRAPLPPKLDDTISLTESNASDSILQENYTSETNNCKANQDDNGPLNVQHAVENKTDPCHDRTINTYNDKEEDGDGKYANDKDEAVESRENVNNCNINPGNYANDKEKQTKSNGMVNTPNKVDDINGGDFDKTVTQNIPVKDDCNKEQHSNNDENLIITTPQKMKPDKSENSIISSIMVSNYEDENGNLVKESRNNFTNKNKHFVIRQKIEYEKRYLTNYQSNNTTSSENENTTDPLKEPKIKSNDIVSDTNLNTDSKEETDLMNDVDKKKTILSDEREDKVDEDIEERLKNNGEEITNMDTEYNNKTQTKEATINEETRTNTEDEDDTKLITEISTKLENNKLHTNGIAISVK